MCGKRFSRQKDNFSYSQSPYFKGNNSYLPICKSCIDSVTEQYAENLGSQDEAIKRTALHWDMYVSDSLLSSTKKIDADRSRVSCYIKDCNLNQNAGKTYDTYLDEQQSSAINSIEEFEELKNDKSFKITSSTIKFFGLGFSESEYEWLLTQYKDWTARHECKTKAQEELFKNISIAQLNIQKAIQSPSGKVDAAMDTFQKLLGSANIKPTQTNDNALADQNTFGTLIQKWEVEKPIPEPEPEWKDVDGIIRYISVWFLGHLCKMMGIKNSYSKLYEDEMLKYKVQKPQYEDDDEILFDNLFNGDNNGD